MKKNVVAILVDSLFVDCLGNKRTKESSSPFMDKIISEAIFANNVYSFAPYTDAATKGLFCSMPTLSEYGYYFGINGSSLNPYKVFKENGYETFGIYYPYYLTSPRIEQYIDHSIYTTGFAYYGIWRGQFDYYASEIKHRKLTDNEELVIKKCVELLFKSWKLFYINLKGKSDSGYIVLSIKKENMDINSAIHSLESEELKFKKNPIQYVNSILLEGMNHRLASIDPFDINKHINPSYLDSLYLKHRILLSKANQKNFLFNLRNNRFSIKKAIHGFLDFIRTRDKYELKYPINYWLCLTNVKNNQRYSYKPNWQYSASARMQIEAGFNSIKGRDRNKPFYAFFHFDDVHQHLNYFSYDIWDEKKNDEEFAYIKPMIDSVDKQFVGSLSYQMAIRYIDFCIKLLFEKLKEDGLDKNTVVVIYADHGSSYTYYPIRKRTVNCFHRENYNVPMVIWDCDLKSSKLIESRFLSSDIYPTLYDYLNLKVNDEMYGRSMLKDKFGHDYVITEYMGPGCPDMFKRDVWMSLRNDNFMISYKSCIDREFDRKHPHQIFDLRKDPYEKKNLARIISIDSSDICGLIDILEKRFNKIKEERDLFITSLKNNEISFDN